MDAVLFLILVLVASCALSVWTASGARADRKRIDTMESVVSNQGNVISSLVASLGGDGAPTSAVPTIGAPVPGSALADASTVLENATDEDLAAAAAVLKKLGLGD